MTTTEEGEGKKKKKKEDKATNRSTEDATIHTIWFPKKRGYSEALTYNTTKLHGWKTCNQKRQEIASQRNVRFNQRRNEKIHTLSLSLSFAPFRDNVGLSVKTPAPLWKQILNGNLLRLAERQIGSCIGQGAGSRVARVSWLGGLRPGCSEQGKKKDG